MSTLAFIFAILLGSASSHHVTVQSPQHQHVQPADSLGQQGGG
jgi:hypothetical protein